MTLRILLADDEPGALRFLTHIIRERCPGWEVADAVENGRQALASISNHPPDMVLTDIRMPVMNGLELVRQIRKNWPAIRASLISGHEDFGAAQDAMRLGVSDYLLKPVIPSALVQMLDGARDQILTDRRRMASELVLSAIAGNPVDEAQSALCFGAEPLLSAAFVRVGALPPRSSMGHLRAVQPKDALPDGCWITRGRDDNELFAFERAPGQGLGALLPHLDALLPEGPRTLVLHENPFPLREAKQVAAALTNLSDHALVLGVPQRLNACQSCEPQPGTPLDADMEQRISMLCSASTRTRELCLLLDKLFDAWRLEQRPLQPILRDLDRLLHAVARGALGHAESALGYEPQLDEAMTASADLTQLKARVWGLILGTLNSGSRNADAASTEAFFERVRHYIEQNLAEPISLQSACADMGISQTYMSRIFRRHTTHSFNEYLTSRRIERAKQLILDQPELPLKTVAELVGFKNQFYFSKVFRAVEGIPPSQFQQSETRPDASRSQGQET